MTNNSIYPEPSQGPLKNRKGPIFRKPEKERRLRLFRTRDYEPFTLLMMLVAFVMLLGLSSMFILYKSFNHKISSKEAALAVAHEIAKRHPMESMENMEVLVDSTVDDCKGTIQIIITHHHEQAGQTPQLTYTYIPIKENSDISTNLSEVTANADSATSNSLAITCL